MSQTFIQTREPLNFYEFPEKVIVSVKSEMDLFLYQTGIKINSQEHHEVTRQIFDYIDFGFTEFNNLLLSLPIFKLLCSFSSDQTKYMDLSGNYNSLALNLKEATKQYGLSIYMTCKKVGIFEDDKTPYILESIQDDLLLLYNGFTKLN